MNQDESKKLDAERRLANVRRARKLRLVNPSAPRK